MKVLIQMLTFLPLSLALTAALAYAQDHAQPGPPETRRDNVVDTISGHQITDPYRWLEDAHSPETQKWVTEQQQYTQNVLAPLPQREQIRARLTELAQIGVIGTPQVGGNHYFHTRREGKQNQPVLYVREGVSGVDRVLVDVNALAADGTVALDWYYPTHDGKYVAYGTSPSGSEISTLHIIDTATGKHLPDKIERTRAASIAWKRDNSGFYYTRYPKPGDVAAGQEMYNRHVFYHQLGSDPGHDPEIFGTGRDPQDWPNVFLSEDDRWLTIGVEQGWAKSEVFLLDLKSPDAKPVRVTDGKEFLYSGFVHKGTLYLTTNEDAPRFKVLTASASQPGRANWKPLIAQSEDVLTGLDYIGGTLVASYEHVATNRLRVFSTEGKPQAEIPLPTLGSITGVGGIDDGSEAFFTFTSFTMPTTAYRYDLKSAKAEVWKKLDTTINPDDYEVKQVFYPSKDGTKVPMFIVNKKGVVHGNGKNAALLTGYGGFNISSTPHFSSSAFLWLENDGVYAVANLRGGSEYGEDWHRAGMLGKKQNVFDDFIAAGEYLISQKYTMKQHLAIMGGSNGGLLVGAAITQRPELWRAAVCAVPLLDMLRYQRFQIAKLWIPEYGTAEDPKQFDFIYAYSPYHHVKPGVAYPATMFVTADTDTRVDPLHAKKMAALMQSEAANGKSKTQPVLLRIESKAGHGAGKPLTKQIEESTDEYNFLMWQTGMRVR